MPDQLVPELRDAEKEFDSALDEACGMQPAAKADTGELIRADELLEAASDAAKRAISLRRRRRADSARPRERGERAGRGVLGDAEAAASPDAAHRAFADARGVQWDVFAVHPEPRLSTHSQLKGTYPQGWLCFDSGTEKRRLSPIPDDWMQITTQQLEMLCQRAEVASRRRSGGGPRKEASSEDQGASD